MSQAYSHSDTQESGTIATELNRETEYYTGEDASPDEVVDAYTNLAPEKQRGRKVLGYQVPEIVAEELLTSLPLTLLYSYKRETETVTAWKINETTKALISYNDPSRSDGSWYMLPPLGETRLDLRWVLFQSVHREIPIEITYLEEETLRSILKCTRPEHRDGTELLIQAYTVDRQ